MQIMGRFMYAITHHFLVAVLPAIMFPAIKPAIIYIYINLPEGMVGIILASITLSLGIP